MSTWVGIIGMMLIVIAWLPQTIENIKKKKSDINIKFVIAYLIGSLILLVYALMINDLVFSILNIAAAAQSFINLVIELGEKGRRKK